MTKIVTIDARWLVGGIGTYTENLLRELAHICHNFSIRAIARPADASGLEKLCSRVVASDVPIYTLREQISVPKAARGSDLLHVPHFNVPLLYRGSMVVSIMDVIHLQAPEYRGRLKSLMYARPMLNIAAHKADHIITVSQFSKDQIVKALGVPSARITVIHCGVNEQFRPSASNTRSRRPGGLNLDRPYLLYVGNLKPHKNVGTLLRAFARVCGRRHLPHSLLLVGNDLPGRAAIFHECRRLRITDRVVFAPLLSPAELSSVYAHADLFVLPSTMEGFGLPVIEAMACGAPVICTAAASLPEVAGDAAIFFNPSSVDELAERIELLLNSVSLQEQLRQKGLQRAKQFSWQEAAYKHLEIYRAVLDLKSDRAASPVASSCQEAV